MVDVSQRSELSLLDHDALARAVGSILDRHEEIQDWTILYTQRELGMRYPGIDFSTASTLAKIATDPGLSKEFDQSLTADAIERMRAVPLPTRPERRSDAGWIGNGVLDRFLEDESLFGEFLRTPVSEGGVEPLVVEPPHVVVEVGA